MNLKPIINVSLAVIFMCALTLLGIAGTVSPACAAGGISINGGAVVTNYPQVTLALTYPATLPPTRWHSSAVRKMPINVPRTRRSRSRPLTLVRAGRNARHHTALKKGASRACPAAGNWGREGGIMRTKIA